MDDLVHEITEEPSIDYETKDEFGAIKILRDVIDQKYKITEHLGKGSYGMVSKGTCLKTGKEVALKIMNTAQTKMEYDVIKTLREIQLLKRLNDLSEELYN